MVISTKLTITVSSVATTANLVVESIDQFGNTITGYFIVIFDASGNQLATGYTPYTYAGIIGTTYQVQAQSYGTYTFTDWFGGTNGNDIITLPSAGMTIIAVYNNTAAPKTGLIVPLYIYPPWNTLIAVKQSYPKVPVIAVINPNSGPGPAQDPNYVTGINAMRAAGIIVVGYVNTQYGANTEAFVESQINSYHSWYTLDGIFFDNMSTSTSTATYYTDLNTYAKGLGYTTTVGNPGTMEPTSMLGIFTVEILYENAGLPSSISAGEAFIAYNVSTLPSLTPYATASYIYITDGAGGNETGAYQSLPSYLTQEMAALSNI